MHSIRPRPTCCAHSTSSPAIALCQHFVAPNLHLPYRPPKFLFATNATSSRSEDNVRASHAESAKESDPIHVRKVGGPSVRKIKTTYSDFVVNPELHTKPPTIFRHRRKNLPRNDAWRDKTSKKPHRGEKGQNVNKLLNTAYKAYKSSQDYDGVVVLPASSPEDYVDHNVPWNIRGCKNVTVEEQLNLEINKFHEYIRPSPAESVAREHVAEQVRHHVRRCLPGYDLEVFGSERTGLSFAKSDIDLRLVPNALSSHSTQAHLPPPPEQRSQMRLELKRLHTCLMRDYENYYLLPVVRWARYPLISLQDRISGLDIQIVLSNDTALSRRLMQRYMEEFPYLRQVYSVIKATLDVRGLTNVFRGCIGSYSLFMMIVASLKHHPSPINDGAGALMNFLTFWGSFEADQHGLSIEPPEYLSKINPIMNEAAMGKINQGKIAPLPPWILNLRDPADETNDLGRKIVAWKHIKTTFMSLSKLLREDMEKSRPILLSRFVGPVYTLQKAHRRRLSECGQLLSAANRPNTPSDTSEDAAGHEQAFPDRVQLQAIAQSIRKSAIEKEPAADAEALSEAAEDSKKQPVADAEALGNPKETAQIDHVQGMATWLKEMEDASEHKETGKAFSNILGLDKKTHK